ncbi:MAG: hypothetical protein M1831_004189 [Alyxoria varia]|nr:MAG: hypothetical protein M1831_004189 [Alyxoria varia]
MQFTTSLLTLIILTVPTATLAADVFDNEATLQPGDPTGTSATTVPSTVSTPPAGGETPAAPSAPNADEKKDLDVNPVPEDCPLFQQCACFGEDKKPTTAGVDGMDGCCAKNCKGPPGTCRVDRGDDHCGSQVSKINGYGFAWCCGTGLWKCWGTTNPQAPVTEAGNTDIAAPRGCKPQPGDPDYDTQPKDPNGFYVDLVGRGIM